jgi:hypothetical protein
MKTPPDFSQFTDEIKNNKTLSFGRVMGLIAQIVKLAVLNLPAGFWLRRNKEKNELGINVLGVILLVALLPAFGLARIHSFPLALLLWTAYIVLYMPLSIGAVTIVAEGTVKRKLTKEMLKGGVDLGNGKMGVKQLSLSLAASSVTFLKKHFTDERPVIIPEYEQQLSKSEMKELLEKSVIQPAGASRFKLTEIGILVIKTS